MTLLQLQYFVSTAGLGSTLQASESLNVSQSTVSTAIKNLEEELGVRLFTRSSKGLTLNQAGRCLLAHAEEILARVDDAVQDMNKYAADLPPVRIGIPVILSANYWPDLYVMFQNKMPEAAFDVVNGGTRQLLEMLEKNRLEFVICLNSVPVSGRLRGEKLMNGSKRTISVSVSHPLAQKKSVTYEEIIPYPVLGYEGDEVKTAMLRNIYEKKGKELKYAQRCSQISTLLQLLRKNAGVAYLNEKLTENESGIVTLPIEDADFSTYPLCIFWNDSARAGVRAQKIIRLVREYFSGESAKAMREREPENKTV